MRTILHAQRRSAAAAAVLTAAVGLFVVCKPGLSVRFLCLALGIAILGTGLIYILGWLARRREGVSVLLLLPGVILCALGVWLMTSPTSAITLVQFIFGAILLFHGAVDLQGAFALARRGWGRWWADLALGVLTLVLGAVVLLRPLSTFGALVVLIGLALIFDGVSDLYIIWRLSRAFRDGEGEDDG